MYEEVGATEEARITIDRSLAEDDLGLIRELLTGLPGVEFGGHDASDLTIEYPLGVVSRQMIVEALADAGYTEQQKEPVGALQRTLKRMADSGEASFGSGKLDCCSLNDERHPT